MNCRVSVAMASYNGETYIQHQIESILNQLGENDEIIISDDGSTDDTIMIIKDFMSTDHRIKLVKGPKCGVIKNFENAINHAKGDYIFLCDQDDIWAKNKISKVLTCFKETNCTCVIHDTRVIDNKQNTIIPSFFEFRNSKAGVIHNIIKNSYIGCCMAFRRELLDEILPIPTEIHMHDQWIGIISDIYGKTTFLDDSLLLYRRHEDNASALSHYPVSVMLKNRFILVKELIKHRIAQFRKKIKRQ